MARRTRKKRLTRKSAKPALSGTDDYFITGNLRVYPSNCQHIGTRAYQEDAFAFSDPQDEGVVEKGGVLAVLADGMGGLACGSQASRTAVKVFLNKFTSSRAGKNLPDQLWQMMMETNQVLHNLAGRGPDLGTTLVAAVVRKAKLHWISVGDSRIYHYLGSQLNQLSCDHLYSHHLQQAVERGNITAQAAAKHPERYALTSYLGLPELTEISRSTTPLALQTGDRVVLCSDGLYNTLTETEISETLGGITIHADAAGLLVQAALARAKQSQDNLTVQVLSCG